MSRRTLTLIFILANLLGPLGIMAAMAEPDGLVDIATMKSQTAMDIQRGTYLRMVVDTELNLGVATGNFVEDGRSKGQHLMIYDLVKLRLIDKYPVPNNIGLPDRIASYDQKNHRVLYPLNSESLDAAGCTSGPHPSLKLLTFEVPARRWKEVSLPCTATTKANLAPDPLNVDGDQFYPYAFTYHAATDKFYALGSNLTETSARSLVTAQGQNQQTILLRQIDATKGTLDWEIDLRLLGCDTVSNAEYPPLLGRHGNDVFSYCYGVRDSIEGSQGYAIWVPLENEMPKSEDGRAVVRRTPTLPNFLYPMLDTGSGRMLLLTAGTANGNAVWVYNGVKERFYGVIASGVPGGDDRNATTYAGLNPANGRTYLLTSAGMLVADARNDPLPSGLSYPVLTDVRGQGSGLYLAVAPKLNRIFVPVAGRGFAVIEDRVPEPPPEESLDPDRGTADVAETPGKTGSVFTGAGGSYGAHVLLAGGVTRVINNRDPFCVGLEPTRQKDSQGRCTAEQILTSGNREMFLALSQTELGSETGAAAEAAGVAFSTKDSATDADFKRLSACERDVIQSKTGATDEQIKSLDDACGTKVRLPGATEDAGFDMFGGGTRGKDGDGFPLRTSTCEDFEGEKVEDRQRPTADGMPWHSIGASNVSCSKVAKTASGEAQANLFAWPSPSDALVSIGRTTSKTTTEVLGVGTVTTSEAIAENVRIGTIAIGRIRTKAVTTAHGRTNSTSTTFERTISEVHGAGIDCSVCDHQMVVDRINSLFGQRLHASIPEAFEFKSPKGYQSIVIKDPAERDSDRAVNDDDTYAIPGLQVVVYNDGYEGRSRLILKLAGVQSESRYGIFLLPEEVPFTDEGSLDSGIDIGALDDLSGLGGPTIIEKIKKVIEKGVGYPVAVIQDAYKLLVANPKQFGVLFVMWSLLGSPVYLAIRRAAFMKSIA